MSRIEIYQQMYRNRNKLKIKQQQKELYTLYKNEYLPCVFCSKIIQLNSALLHLGSVKCKEIQGCVDNYAELLILLF